MSQTKSHLKSLRAPRRIGHWRSKRGGYLFILPALIFLLGFVVFPIIYNIVISLEKVDVNTLAGFKPFVGVLNYKSVIDTSVFGVAFWNTLYFTVVCIFFQFVIGLSLALLFTRKFAINQFARGILLVSWLIPILIASEVWRWIFTGDSSGIINFVLLRLHFVRHSIVFMGTGGGAMFALIVTNIWRGVPFNMVLLFTALLTLPPELIEAASIDGASRMQRFWHITIAWIRPSMVTVVMLGFVYTFKTFDLVFIMTNGGPADTTQNLATLAYRLTFTNFNFGKGAAVADVMFVILVVVGLVSLRFIRKDEVMS